MFYDDRNRVSYNYDSQESSPIVASNQSVEDLFEKIISQSSSNISTSDPHNVVPPDLSSHSRQYYPILSSQMYNVCPPNITITSREPIPPLPPTQESRELLRQGLYTSALHDVNLSLFDEQNQSQSNDRHRVCYSNANVLNWMKANDDSVNKDNKSIKELLNTPEIINNQCSSLTKSLYSMKGFARDFQDYRTKLHLTVSDICQRLSHLFGQNLEEKLISDFEDLLLSSDDFKKVDFYNYFAHPMFKMQLLFSAKIKDRILDAVSEKDREEEDIFPRGERAKASPEANKAGEYLS